MKLKNAHYFIPLLQAAAQGKILQCQSSSGDWWDVTENTEISFTGAPETWRIKPSEPTLRPWKPEEVPVGAVVKFHLQRSVIMGINSLGEILLIDSTRPQVNAYPINVLDNTTYSLDYGKTWQPCGVME